MSSEESKPRSVMSRSKETGKVVSGGRSIKYRRVTSWPPGHRSGWPTTAEASTSPEQPAKRQKRKRVPPTGLPPDPDTEEDPSNVSYKAVYKARMREVYGTDSEMEAELAGVRLQSSRSASDGKNCALGLATTGYELGSETHGGSPSEKGEERRNWPS